MYAFCVKNIFLYAFTSYSGSFLNGCGLWRNLFFF